MQFSQIIGQASTKQHLLNTVKDNRISHSQLFVGHSGYGTLPLALAYAQYIMCENKGESDSCGECSSCKKVKKLVHPDLHFSFPTVGVKSGIPFISDDYIIQWREFLLDSSYNSYPKWLAKMDAGNTQGLIKVREADRIVKKLSLKSFEADYKILIMWYPEKMNTETANKLLKLIEEPPEKTLFIFLSENPGLIINTIRSRTQLVNIPRISEDDLFLGLKEKFQLKDERARHISRMSEGNLSRAIELLETSEESQLSFDAFVQMMRLSFMGSVPNLIKWVDEIAGWGRERQTSFLAYSLKMIRDNLVINQKRNKIARVSDEEEKFATNFSKFIHPLNTPLISDEINLAIMHIMRNANAKVVLLDLCLKLNKLLKMESY